MKLLISSMLALTIISGTYAQGDNEDPSFVTSPNLEITDATVTFDDHLDQFIFSIQVKGLAGKSIPKPAGSLDGAPVLGYVFPTTLKSTDVGFGDVEGLVAMALTSHPDFDDTPLWDENNDRNYDNDGIIWHPHWVILTKNTSVPGGLSVKQFDPKDTTVILPPTNPGMPMYMDSPGYPVIEDGNSIKVVIPSYRINRQTKFNFDAVAVYMQVNGSNPDLPMLGVYNVYSIASGDLSLPFSVD